jgi:putative hydrolase of the HAD superfamily
MSGFDKCMVAMSAEQRMNLRAIIFDAYGTLIDTGDGSVRATRAILRKNGCDLDAGEVYARWKQYHRMRIESLATFVNEEAVFLLDLKRLYADYGIVGTPEDDVGIMLATLGVRRLFPETLDVVGELRKRYQVFIASTSDTAPLESDLARNGLAVDGYFTSESLRIYKPAREFYLRVLSEIGHSADEALFVGDSLRDDVWGPAGAGMRTVWVNRESGPIPPHTDILPNHEIHDLRELLAVIR